MSRLFCILLFLYGCELTDSGLVITMQSYDLKGVIELEVDFYNSSDTIWRGKIKIFDKDKVWYEKQVELGAFSGQIVRFYYTGEERNFQAIGVRS